MKHELSQTKQHTHVHICVCARAYVIGYSSVTCVPCKYKTAVAPLTIYNNANFIVLICYSFFLTGNVHI